MQVLCFDGPENVGKTFTIKIIKELIQRRSPEMKVIQVHFPSDKICSSDIFRKMVEPHEGFDLEKEFIDMLIKEEMNFLGENVPSYNNENYIFLIDRFILSSLVYQGTKSRELENYILDKYENLFNKFGLGNKLHHIVFMTQMGVEENPLNEAKKILDSQNESSKQKYKDLIYRIQTNQLPNKLFKSFNVLDFTDITKGEIPNYFQKSLILSLQIEKILTILDQ